MRASVRCRVTPSANPTYSVKWPWGSNSTHCRGHRLSSSNQQSTCRVPRRAVSCRSQRGEHDERNHSQARRSADEPVGRTQRRRLYRRTGRRRPGGGRRHPDPTGPGQERGENWHLTQPPNGLQAAPFTQQDRFTLRFDARLAECGTDKSRLLWAQLWVTDMRNFAAMNEVWDAWIDPACATRRFAPDSAAPSSRPTGRSRSW